jgi:hypothetical protein
MATPKLLPLKPYAEFVDGEGRLSPESYQFLLNMYLNLKVVVEALEANNTI